MQLRIHIKYDQINIDYGYWISFEGDENILKLDCGDGCMHNSREYTKHDWTVNLKWVNFMACELYLNKVIFV